MKGELAYAGVERLGDLLARREVSAVDVAEGFLERLERLGPRLNAVAALMPDRALAEARRADAELAAGQSRGPLHGIPYGAKDLLAARGAPTTWGAPPLRDQVFDFDAAVVERLGMAGAVLVAKLGMVELAGGGGYKFPDASLQGPGKTPWSLDHWSGGSSSGSGSAVAAGLVPYAIGSETSGSIVTPCAYCGVTGLRPTYGAVSRRGAMPLAWTLDKLGPMARSAEDCALVFAAMAGVDPGDPTTRPLPTARELPKRIRVGFAPADFEELAAEGARTAFAQALRDVRDLDVELVESGGLPRELPYRACVQTVVSAEAASIFGDFVESGQVDGLRDARQIAGLKAGLNVTARAYLDAMRARSLIQAAFARIFERVDVLLCPARSRGATRLDEPTGALAVDRPNGEPRPEHQAIIPAGNLAGLPALAFPCGFDTAGLPLGLQVVGRPFDEPILFELGRRFQAATDWHRRVPPGFE